MSLRGLGSEVGFVHQYRPLQHPGKIGHNSLDRDVGCVDAQVIVGFFTEGLHRHEVVVFSAALVDVGDGALQLLVGHLFAGLSLHPAADHLVIQIGIDKNPVGMIVREDIITAPADDDAVGFFGKLLEQAALLPEDGLPLLVHDNICRLKADADMDWVGEDGLGLHDILDIAFRQLRFLCDLCDDLLIIVGKSQFFRQTAAEFPSPAAEFTADGDDFIHENLPSAALLPAARIAVS